MSLASLLLDGIRYMTVRGGVTEQTGVDALFNQARQWSLPLAVEEGDQADHITGLFHGYPVPMILPDGTVVPLVTITPATFPAVIHEVNTFTVVATEVLP